MVVMRKIKMVVTDLDGTLLRRDKTISTYTVNVFRSLRERGILTVFASARPFDSSQPFRDVINPDADVVSGGCLVYVGTQLLRAHYLPMPQADKLLAELGAYPLITKVSARSFDKKYSSIPIEGRICVDFRAPVPDKLLHCSCRTDDEDFMQAIAMKYPEFSFIKDAESDLYDINSGEATKLNGIKEIANYFDICLSEIVAFGDGYSDVEMLQYCGTGVAMSNSVEKCKAVSDSICEDCDNDGVAHWLDNELLTIL